MMKKIILFSFLALLLLGCEKDLINQDDSSLSTGLVPSDQQSISLVAGYIPPVGGPVGAPPFYDLSPLMPPVGNQGSQFSCVAWTLGYYLQSYHQKLENNYSYSDDSKLMSPAYLYNLGNVSVQNGSGSCQNAGSNFLFVLDILKNQGVSTLQDFPYDANNCSSTPSPSINSFINRIESYVLLFQQNSTVSDIDKVNYTKINISTGTPVVIGYWIDRNWTPQSNNGVNDVIYHSHTTNQSLGAHASLVVGYDDSKNAFKVINSWGNNWANNGYFWIDYDFFTEIVFEAYVTQDYLGPNTSSINSDFSTSTSTNISVNQNVSFVDESTGNPVSWEWNFPGGNASSTSTQNPVVTYTTSGTYLVSLKVTNANGDFHTETKQDYITVSPSGGNVPVANFIGNPTTVSVGQPVQLTDLSSNAPTSWLWSFPNGSASSITSQNPTVTYNSPGTYNVSLTASNSFGPSVIEEKIGYITVTTAPPTCQGTFTDTRDGQQYCYVTIGSQTWMAENLNYDDGAGSWCYNSTNYYCNQFGRLYSWSNFMNGGSATNQTPSGVQGICPNGWHVPSTYEVQELLDNYSSDADAYVALIDGGSSGFDAKLGGYANLASSTLLNGFFGLNSSTSFWTTSETSTGGVFHYFLSFSNSSGEAKTSWSGEEGMSCRCLQN